MLDSSPHHLENLRFPRSESANRNNGVNDVVGINRVVFVLSC